MNPLPLLLAELRRNRSGCAAIVALIAMAVAFNVASSAQLRALRLASARAADPLDLVVQDLVRSVVFAFDGLLMTAVLIVLVAALSARRQRIGALRALGAPPTFLFVAVWLHGAMLTATGVLLGLVAGFALSKAMGAIATAQVGFDVYGSIGAPELALAGTIFTAGLLFAATPSFPLLRSSAAHLLRSA